MSTFLLHILEAPKRSFDDVIIFIELDYFVISIISSKDIAFEPLKICYDLFFSNLKLLCTYRLYNTYVAEKVSISPKEDLSFPEFTIFTSEATFSEYFPQNCI